MIMILHRDWSSPKYFGVIISFRNLIKMPLKKSRQCSQPLTSSYMSRSWVYILKVYKKSANSGHIAFLISGIGIPAYTWLILKYEKQISKKAVFWNLYGHGFVSLRWYGIKPQMIENSCWLKFLRVFITSCPNQVRQFLFQ